VLEVERTDSLPSLGCAQRQVADISVLHEHTIVMWNTLTLVVFIIITCWNVCSCDDAYIVLQDVCINSASTYANRI